LGKRIVFYEDKNFQGRSYECDADCPDMHPHVSRCNSVRVESGCWVLYEKSNYMGYQYVLTRGEYPEYQRWMGYNDTIRSCRTFSYHRGSYRMRLYNRRDFGGQMMELMDDCPNTMDRFHMSDFMSCNVMDGHWLMYDQPNYRGRMMYMRPGEYRNFRDWGWGSNFRIGSIRRMMDGMM
uniref:Beta/gamma crystallin 'Greek key' domain-containing protein n=1 Tax=Astyanax mexicanus TaxID=7994 RepID=A0A8B9JCR2_ASTMX